MKPVGKLLKAPVGQHQQAAVDDEHERRHAQQLADDATCSRRCDFERRG